MDEEFNPQEAVSTGSELNPEEGVRNEGPSDGALRIIEETTGRKYPDLDTAKKSLKETFNYVGKAGQYEKMVKTIADKLELGDEKGVLDWLEELESKSEPASPAESDKPSQLAEKVAELEFVIAHPEVKEHLPFLKKLAKAEGGLEAAFSSGEFQEYLKAKTALKESEERTSVIESNQRVGFRADKVQPLIEQYQKTGAEADAIKLVEEALDLKKK